VLRSTQWGGGEKGGDRLHREWFEEEGKQKKEKEGKSFVKRIYLQAQEQLIA